MSALSVIASSLLTSSAMVAIPTAGILLADAPSIPSEARAAIWIMGGFAFLVAIIANLGRALPVLRSIMGLRGPDSGPGGAPDHHGAHLVTHAELEARLLRIELKIDGNAKESRDDLHGLTKTMESCFRDMSKAIGSLEGKLSNRAGL